MTVILRNNVSSTLATGLSASDTTLVVADGSLFPSPTGDEYFYATLASPAGVIEIVKVTARVGNSLTVVRAQDGSSAFTFQVGALVEMRVNTATIQDTIQQASDQLETSFAAFVAGQRVVRDVAGLLADTSLTYTPDTADTVAAGDLIRTQVEGYVYEVAASGAADQHATTGGGVKLYEVGPVFSTRERLAAWLARVTAAGGSVPDGAEFSAGGFHYQFSAGATAIDDIPGLLPAGEIYAEHFGAAADLSWRQLEVGDLDGVNAGTYGPQRLSGTNDFNAIRRAMEYAAPLGRRVVVNGDTYVRCYVRLGADGSTTNFDFDLFYNSESEIVVHLYDSTGADPDAQHTIVDPADYTVVGATILFNTAPAAGLQVEVCVNFSVVGELVVRGVLWTQYALTQVGVDVSTSYAKYSAQLTIGAYSYNGSKPSNNGQWGPVIATQTGYYRLDAPERVDNASVTSAVTRAARVLADASNSFQDSDSATMTVRMGNVFGGVYRLAAGPRTNTASLMMHLMHWGGTYTPPGGVELLDKTSYPVTEKWLPERCEVYFETDLDGDDHGFIKGWELAETVDCYVGPCVVRNATHVYWVGVGDLAGAFVTADQANRANMGNRAGFQTGYNIAPGDDIYAVLYKGDGTSKFETHVGTAIAYQRTSKASFVCDGHHIECATGTTEGIRARQPQGYVDFGPCYITGATLAAYILGGNGGGHINVIGGDGLIRYDRAKGWRLSGTKVHRGDDRNNTADGLTETGYESNNAAVQLRGSYPTTTTSAAASAGDRTISINAFPGAFDSVAPGDRLVAKNGSGDIICETRATDYDVQGSLVLNVEALPEDIPIGTTLMLDHGFEVLELNCDFSSSEFGVYAENGTIRNANFERVGWTGRHHAKLYNVQMEMTGRLPTTAARRVSSASDQAIWCDANCAITYINPYVPKNEDGDKAFFLQTDVGLAATLTLIGGTVEDLATLADATTDYDQVRMFGTVDLDGNPHLSCYNGELSFTPAIEIGAATTGVTYALQEGWAIVDDRFVDLHAHVQLTSKGALAGTVTMDVPLSALGTYEIPCAVVMDNVNFATNEHGSAYVDGSIVRFVQQSNTDAPSMTDAQLLDTTEIWVNARYRWR